ncbi:heat shock cognate 71 kDa protein-like isoform X2 [Sitodiplosis mosellana]|uniref:heat shock cognate 71 kDa protein-like isoform X2 n=1 Tax=Sitodiplosis mosellana TaxID=263140 RepID=UPI0024439097|nr:heat shock cognate 71 kDa protein-like isoform X2 [Sitodiplosis mosellana]
MDESGSEDGNEIMTISVPVAGIDFGAASTRMAVFEGRTPASCFDYPSYVAFTETERLIGIHAKKQAGMNQTNTVFGVKRLIGCEFDDEAVQPKNWPFCVKNVDNKPKIEVQYEGHTKQFSPEDISFIVLADLKEYAETCLKKTVNDAIVTVPSYFNDSQRQATKDVVTECGFVVHRIIDEPTALVCCYGANKKFFRRKSNIFVCDWGASLDITIFSIDIDGKLEQKSTVHETHLGSEEFDKNVADHILNEFEKEMGSQWIAEKKTDKNAMRKLYDDCERVKIELSTDNISNMSFFTITREVFENLNAKLFEGLKKAIKKALHNAQLKKDDITDIVLAGGLSNIPKVKNLLRDEFQLSPVPHCDNAVGAAYFCSMVLSNAAIDESDILNSSNLSTISYDGWDSGASDKLADDLSDGLPDRSRYLYSSKKKKNQKNKSLLINCLTRNYLKSISTNYYLNIITDQV